MGRDERRLPRAEPPPVIRSRPAATPTPTRARPAELVAPFSFEGCENERSCYYCAVTKGDETRSAILGRAIDLASSVGLVGVTIGRLSRDLGMSKSGLFAHFRSKEALQLEVIEAAAERFTDEVVRPAFRAAAGEPRLRSLFDNWVAWAASRDMRGGCLFVQASVEFDDQGGMVRERLVEIQRTWLDALAEAARRAVAVRHFHDRLDADQFAYALYSLMLGYHHAWRLLHDPRAEDRLRTAFEALLAGARRQEHTE